MKTRNIRMIGAGAVVLALAGVGATAVAQDNTPRRATTAPWSGPPRRCRTASS